MKATVYAKAAVLALPLSIALINPAVAQIPGLCNSGQTAATSLGCTGVLVTPNATGGGPNRDGNWRLAFPYPSVAVNPCLLDGFTPAWVDTPPSSWLPNSASSVSEWITPYDGEGQHAQGAYVYRIAMHVPAKLPGGFVPVGVTINGQTGVDNGINSVWLQSPAVTGACALMSGQLPTTGFSQWGSFSFNNTGPLTPGAFAYLYFVVNNAAFNGYPNATGFRVEFFSTSKFH